MNKDVQNESTFDFFSVPFNDDCVKSDFNGRVVDGVSTGVVRLNDRLCDAVGS